MRYLKIVLRVLALIIIVALFDYNLPSRDIVQIVGTEVVRTDIGSNSLFWAQQDSGTGTDLSQQNRDVRFINTARDDGSPRVYRNEDTGWGWPFYLKFNSGNLQAEAQQLAGSGDWVAVKHYGWRSTLFSIYPNATSISPVTGPSVSLIPWVRIVAAILLLLAAVIIWRLWVRTKAWTADRMDRLKSKF
ncbi:MAG: DUF1523 family protein [Rhodobacteraceae bacterium]|nr:DUF1523 family protein [Paracoccaceae bacterium]